MSEFIYDPRPLDPPDYFDREMSNTVTWTVVRYVLGYDKTSRCFTQQVFYKHGEDKMSDVLQMIADIYSGDSPELCEIVIDATQVIPAPPISVPVHYNIKYSDREGISWEIKKNNKPWAQFRCQNPAGGFLEKCEPVWLEINKDGKWVKQKGRG